MLLSITRDSVCAADDIDEHLTTVSIQDDATVEQVVGLAVSSADLPKIGGGKATWVVSSNRPLAVVAQQWKQARTIPMIPPRLKELDFDGAILKIHIGYLTQQDPDTVLNVLQTLKLKR
jgi:hypothetical protein